MPTTVNARGVLLSSFRNGEKMQGGGGGGGGGGVGGGGISFESFNEGGTAGGGSMALPPSRSLDAESVGSRGSRASSGSSRRSRGSRGEDESANNLRGNSTVLVVRLKGQVHGLETCNRLLGRGPLLGVIDSFLVPPMPAFIAPLPLDVARPPAAAYAPSKLTSLEIERARHAEVRNVCEEVAFDLFRSLLGAFPVTEYTRQVMGMRPAAAAKEPAPVPRVASTVGIFFRELSASGGEEGVAGAERVEEVDGDVAGIVPEEEAQAAGTERVETLPLLLLPQRAVGEGVDLASSLSSPSRRQREEERKRKELLMDAAATAALGDADFVDLASEILRNTFFNLLSEAAADEFSIFSEPLKFMMRSP